MVLEVVLQQNKKTLIYLSKYESEFTFDACNCKVDIDNECLVRVSGEGKQHLIEVFRVIWEVICLYEGYFFDVASVNIDGAPFNPQDLYQLSYYRTGTMWIQSAGSLVGDNFILDQKSLDCYYRYRDQSFDQHKMVRALINSYFYLRSDSYEHINFSHRLSILLNMCDGFVCDEFGDKGDLREKYRMFIEKYIPEQKFEYGMSLLGVSLSGDDIYRCLSNERTSIDHYIFKEKSLSSYAHTNNLNDGYIITFLIYVLELALRIRLIEKFGKVSPELAIRNVDNINDWVILTLNLDVPCSLPENVFRQQMRKMKR